MLVVWHMQSHHCIKSFEDLALLHNIGCVIPGSNSFVFFLIFFFLLFDPFPKTATMSGSAAFLTNINEAAGANLKKTTTAEKNHLPSKEDIEAEKKGSS